MSCCESSCGGCQKSCSSCSPALYLTEAELKLLRRFGETPFLPVARRPDGETPVCLEEGTGEQETVSNGILALERKGLIDLDYNLPLQNFDYGPYAAPANLTRKQPESDKKSAPATESLCRRDFFAKTH